MFHPGTLVGAGRWPEQSGHPDNWEEPHFGVVLSIGDPEAWVGTAAFPGLFPPTKDQVVRHITSTRNGTAMIHTNHDVPVRWNFPDGEKVIWENPKNIRRANRDYFEWEVSRQRCLREIRQGTVKIAA